MTQYSILVYHRDFPVFMQKLQDKGLLDIKLSEVFNARTDKEFYPTLERMEKLLAGLKTEKKALDAANDEGLKQVGTLQTLHDKYNNLQGENLLTAAEELLVRKKELSVRIEECAKKVKEAEVWGEFDPETLRKLHQMGTGLVLASASSKKFPQNQLEAQSLYPVQIIKEEGGQVYFVWVCSSDQADAMTGDMLAKEVGTSTTVYEIPAKPYSALLADKAALESELQGVNLCILTVLALQDKLSAYKNELFNALTYKTVTLNVPDGAEGRLKVMEGYLPTEKSEEFDAFLEGEAVVYNKCEAKNLSDEEKAQVPVQLRNRWFAKLFEPITGLFSLPDYREIDLTPAVAPFFMAFFGFCLGDAGYGLIILAAGLYIALKMPKAKYLGWLAFMFGVGTIIFGLLGGTFFGISLFGVEWLGNVRNYMMNSDQLMMLSLIIGAVQIIFGMCLDAARITKMQGFKYALYRIGWVLVIVFGACLIGLPMLGVNLPAVGNYVLYALVGIGAVLALFYNKPGKNPILNLGAGLWTTYNTATGLIGDLLSYIRLFALGLTGGILGGVFNSLALSIVDGMGVPVVSHILMLVILLFGHGLNIALCILGALVHPIRLTFVEFYKNAGFVGGGKAYKPFAKK